MNPVHAIDADTLSSEERQHSSAGRPLIDGVADWLMARALSETPMEALLDGCSQRLLAAGIPVKRCNIAFRTLHPLFSAMTVTWYRGEGVRTASIRHEQQPGEAWSQSPHNAMISGMIPHLRRRLTGPEALVDFPVLEEFRVEGATDYLAYLIPFEIDRDDGRLPMGIIGSWLTDRESGFSNEDIRSLMRIDRRLAVACKVTIKDQIARNILTAYLGAGAGDQVLDGRIKRGDGETIHAVVWFNDLRDSTPMADSMPADDFLALLNDYFECTAGAVLAHGGEVLRFVGDAVLAIFPIGDGEAAGACAKAYEAVGEATRRLADLNARRTAAGQAAIDFGIGLHLGDVIYGNIGVAERLEFSVIGPVANEVARLEGLTKNLGRSVLASGEVRTHMPGDWKFVGEHRLRGVGAPVKVYAPVREAGVEQG